MDYLHSIGKKMRMRRLIDPISKAIIAVPMDHGFTLGPIRGIANLRSTVDEVYEGGASCVIVQKGMVRDLVGVPPQKGVMVHISGSVSFSPNSNEKVLTGSVEDAVYLGADGVSCHVNVGASADKNMIADLASITSRADEFSLPVLAMMYARDDTGSDDTSVERIAHVARIAQEAGADIVKVNNTPRGEQFDEVTQGVSIPVVIAGGSKTSDFKSFLSAIENAVLSGASGVSIGRNIFQADQVRQATEKVVEVVRKAMRER